LIWLLILQDNARRVCDRGCAGNTNFGKIAKIGFAPLLWCIIITMLITYIHSVISGKLSSVCDGNKSLYLIFVGVFFSQHIGLLLEQLGQHLGLFLEQLGQQYLGCFIRTAAS
jgi:hypothetical protein